MSDHRRPAFLLCTLALLAALGCSGEEDPIKAAEIAEHENQHGRAIELANQAPDSFKKFMILGRSHFERGELEDSQKAFEKAADLNPDSVEPYLGMAKALNQRALKEELDAQTRAGLEMRAIEKCQNAIKVDSACAEAYALMARVYLRRRELEDAEDAYRRAIDCDPTDPQRKVDLARLLAGMGQKTEASELIDDALSQNSEHVTALILKARILRSSDREQAKEHLRYALAVEEIEPAPQAEAKLLLAQLCYATGQTEDAKRLAGELKRIKGVYGAEARYILGAIYLGEDKWREAYDALKPLEQGARNPAVLMRLALAEQKLGMENQAITHYQQILDKIDPKYIHAHLELARLMLKGAHLEEAMAHCISVLKERPAHPDALRFKAQIHRSSLAKYRNLQLAEACYLRILARHPEADAIKLDVADLYRQMNRPRLAEARAKTVKEKNDNYRYSLVKGRIHILKHYQGIDESTEPGQSNLDQALRHLKQASTFAPTSQPVAEALARAYQLGERPRDAQKVMREFISQNPESPRARLVLASLHEKAGEPRKCIEVLQNATREAGIRGYEALMGELGRAYFLGAQRKEAVETWQQLVARGEKKTHLGVHVGLAVTLALEGDHKNAMTHAQTAVHRAEKSHASLLMAACVAIQAGEYDKARNFLDMGTYPSPKERAAYLEFPPACRDAGANGRRAAALISEAILHSEFGSPETAVARLTEATQRLPNSIIPYYQTSRAMLRARRFKVGDFVALHEKMFQKFRSQGYPHYNLARIARTVPGAPKVREHVELALDLDPDLAPAHIVLAQMLLAESRGAPKLSSLTAAVRHATDALKLDGGTMASLGVAAAAHSNMARYWRSEALKEKDLEARKAKLRQTKESTAWARKTLKALTDKFPRSLPAAKETVRFELIQRDFARAAGLAAGYLQQWQDPELLLFAAMAHMGQGKDQLTDARRYLHELIQLNPRNVTAYKQLARVYIMDNRPEVAALWLVRAVRANPGDPWVRFDLAGTYLAYGEPARAKKEFENILNGVPERSKNAVHREIRRRALVGIANALMKTPAKDDVDRINNLKEAEKKLKDLTEPSGDQKADPRALILLGRIMEAQGQDAAALKQYDRCVKDYPNIVEAYSEKVLVHYRNGEYEKAIRLYADKVLRVRRHATSAYARLALLHLACNTPAHLRQAATAGEEMMKLLRRRMAAGMAPSEDFEAYYRSVHILTLLAVREYGKARGEVKNIPGMAMGVRDGYRQLIGACAGNRALRDQIALYQGAALFYRDTRENSRAVDAYKKAATAAPKNLYLLDRLAALYVRNNDQGKYAAIMEDMIKAADQARGVMTPADHEKLYTDLIDTYVQRLAGKDREALEKAFDVCKRGLEKWRSSVELLKRQAGILLAKRRDHDAIRVLNKILTLSTEGRPPWLEAKKQLALIYNNKDQIDKAAELCRDIEKYIEHDAAWLNNSAWFHATAKEPDLKRALRLAERAKELAPRAAAIRDTLGWIYYLLNRYYKAEPELGYAAQEVPYDANILYHLGAVQANLGKLAQARKNLEKALELHRKGRSFRYVDTCKTLLRRITSREEG